VWTRAIVELALGCLVVTLVPAPAMAIDLGRFLMPGPLVQGHAAHERECGRCHEPFRKTAQGSLCLSCHKPIAEDLAAARGFHGRSPDVKHTECRRCHTDHKGRSADIVRLDPDVFDHALTDFLLQGAHAKVACARCHPAAARHRDAPSTCVGCHKADDPHRGRMGASCQDCHGQQAWRGARFDHDATKFPLRGKHREATCAACHPGQQYRQTPTSCVACHRLNDVHGGRYGARCQTCHLLEGWTRVTFDHDKTAFPLRGGHRPLRCETCHTKGLYESTLGTTCASCHGKDDAHQGRFGARCETCHRVEEWKPVVFDHDRTGFPLLAAHRKVRCATCHTNRLYETKLGTACVGCHRNDDRHHGRYGARCETCHLLEGWARVTFDHDKTAYPLRGGHRKVRCDTCHRGSLQTRLGTTCHGCHAPDDVHRGQQGPRCERCHNEDGWRGRVFFDHDLTRFPLIGLHAVVACEQCHPTTTYKNTPLDCVACHRKQDTHQGRLGPRCALCHNPNGWALWRFDHDAQTRFALTGAHRGLTCQTCHRTVDKEIRMSRQCVACHERDDVHRGAFGPDCERCHVTGSFRDLKIRR
jgi:hypothetical protein